MNKNKKNYYLNQIIIISFIISIGFSLLLIETYIANIYKDTASYIHLLVANTILYLFSFILLYIRKRRQEKQ